MFDIIHEDEGFLVLNKPAGVLVHGVQAKSVQEGEEERETVADWLLRYYPKVRGVGDPSTDSGQAPSTGREQVAPVRYGIVHRLDRDTSGVLIVAKTQAFFEYLKGLFQAHAVTKTYLALVHGQVKEKGVVDKPIGLRAGTVKRSVRARRMKMVKEAVTEYRPLKMFEAKDGGDARFFTLVELTPRTGRTHQLRVHLAAIGHPVAGDELYGVKKNPLGLSRHFLHAESIAFPLPAPCLRMQEAGLSSGKKVRFEAELPDELKHVIDGLKVIG